jgi:hypothetical protein
MAATAAETASSVGILANAISATSLEAYADDCSICSQLARAAEMGAKDSRPDAVDLRAIAYNRTHKMPAEDQLELTDEFASGLVGAPVTVEHAYEKLYEVFERFNKGTVAQRIQDVQKSLNDANHVAGDVIDARVSNATGSLLTTIRLRSVSSQFLKEMKITPDQLSGMGVSLTHGISSEGVHPIELAVTAAPQRPGCRIIGPVRKLNMAAVDAVKQHELAQFLGKLAPDVRNALEAAIESSKMPEILASMDRKDLAKLATLVPEAIAIEVAAASTTKAPAAAAAAAAPAAAATSDSDVTMTQGEATYIRNLLGNLISANNGGVQGTPLPADMSLKNQMTVMAYSLGMTSWRNNAAAAAHSTVPDEPAPKRSRTMADAQPPHQEGSRLAQLMRAKPVPFEPIS